MNPHDVLHKMQVLMGELAKATELSEEEHPDWRSLYQEKEKECGELRFALYLRQHTPSSLEKDLVLMTDTERWRNLYYGTKVFNLEKQLTLAWAELAAANRSMSIARAEKNQAVQTYENLLREKDNLPKAADMHWYNQAHEMSAEVDRLCKEVIALTERAAR